MSVQAHMIDLHMQQELPLLTQCVQSGSLENLHFRLSLWDRERLIGLRREIGLFYQGASDGMRAAAKQAMEQVSDAYRPTVERQFLDSLSEIASFCSSFEISVDLHLKRLEEKR